MKNNKKTMIFVICVILSSLLMTVSADNKSVSFIDEQLHDEAYSHDEFCGDISYKYENINTEKAEKLSDN